jgi:hypothetical protein
VSVDFILSYLDDAATLCILGVLTAAWMRAAWRRWHPHTIRFWGTWSTDPRFLVGGGMLLAAAWIGYFFIA